MQGVYKEASGLPFFVALATLTVASPGVCANESEHDLAMDRWRALLHATDERSQVRDPSFYISDGQRDVHGELEAASRAFGGSRPDPDLECRFPARQFWLRAMRGLPVVGLEHCTELQEFLASVPHESIAVVYSAENLVSPSSMMGHILLKIAGPDAAGVIRNHALSFFTHLDSVNVPKIIFDSLVVGKKGILSLTPYRTKLDFYLNDEGRNVWEYELKTSEWSRRLFMLHIWELKQTTLDYFFDSYNCATITNFLIAVAVPEALPESARRISPIDVIKRVDEVQAVSRRTVITAPKWRARMLSDALGREKTRDVMNFVADRDVRGIRAATDPSSRFLMIELAKQYNDVLNNGPVGERPHNEVRGMLAQLESSRDQDLAIDLSEYKSPITTQPDAQWSIGAATDDDEAFARFQYTAAGHELHDDNRQYFSENELLIASVALLARPGAIKIERLTLYSIQSIIPSEPLLGGISGKFNVGIVRSYDSSLDRQSYFNTSIGLGKAIEPRRAITLYGMISAGAGYDVDHLFPHLIPEIGVIVRERNDFKSTLVLQNRYNELDSGRGIWALNFVQSKFFGQNRGAFLTIEHARSRHETEIRGSLDFKFYF